LIAVDGKTAEENLLFSRLCVFGGFKDPTASRRLGNGQ
jgi:hypothetical protein